ncbi:nose resistant to fluoxetine protein 6 [Drosophila tropicalis]|uniref:nose resistant to fluoxetine protein 6 n=1 Tax=Drosophila tropicalis TaxID=46794 RepID=UPI0035ABF8B1
MAGIVAVIVLLFCGLTAIRAGSSDLELNQRIDIEDYQRLAKLRHLSEEFFQFYNNLTVTDVTPEGRLPSAQDLLCYAELAQLTQAITSGSSWAYKMIDSWGSVPAGILMGHFKDLGHYDECMSIEQTSLGTTSSTILGKYCLANLPLTELLGGSGGMGMMRMFNIQTAVCFPSACAATNMDTMLKRLFKQFLGVELSDNSQLVNQNSCKVAEKDSFDGLTIFTIVFLSIVAGIVGLSTLYDYFLCQDQKKVPVLIKIFSARANSKALFQVSTKKNPNVISSLNGIRCMSLIWVCYGHDYIMGITSPNINYLEVYSWMKSPYMEFINQGVFAVDSFFYLSGLLVAMITLRTMERAKGKLNVPLMYLHRYLRLTPIVAVSILVYYKLLPYLGDGPLYGNWNFDSYDSCKDNWYWTLLYIQNYAADQECLAHTWYLAIDMQLYIISPILLFIVYKWGKKGAAVVFTFTMLMVACLFTIMITKNYSVLNPQGGGGDISHTTHTRTSPWLVGFLFGYFLHATRGKTFKLNRFVAWLGWLFGLACLFVCIFAMYPYGTGKSKTIPILNEAFFVSFSRVAWPVGLSWVVFACMQGYGGLANAFLSSPLWQPLSKLSFCIYMFHLVIQNLNAGRTRVNTYFSDYDMMLRFWQDFGFSVLLAYLMYILIEAPCTGLETLLLPNRREAAKAKLLPIVPTTENNVTPSAPALEAKILPNDVPETNVPAPELPSKTELEQKSDQPETSNNVVENK